MTVIDTLTWTAVCRYDDLQPERAVAALVAGEQVAIVRTHDGSLYAVGNRDPFTGACVLSRGIVGSRADVPVLVSPLHKQTFDLTSGRCLDDTAVAVATYPVRRSGDLVEVHGPTGDARGANEESA